MTDDKDNPKDIPEYKLTVISAHEELKLKVKKLRAEVSMLVLERDRLRFVECRGLETAYMLAVGGLEHKAFEAECEVLRLKRKLEMIQAKLNREEKIAISKINEALDLEFADYQQKITEKIEKINQALERTQGIPFTEEETKEFKKMYGAIVKAMHPDLHPNLSREEQQLFINAIKAYKNGDIETIRMIYTMRGNLIPQDNEDTAAVLRKEITRLEKVLTSLREEIAKIKTEFPYTMKGFLLNKDQIEAKKKELNTIIGQYQETSKLYQERIDAILR